MCEVKTRASALALLCALAMACGDKATETGTEEADADTDADTDTDVDTDTDTDTDTDVDTDTDTDVDTDTDTDVDADTDTDCSSADLCFRSEVRDSSGVVCSTCPADDALSLMAIIENPCTNDIELTTPTSCLVFGYDVINVKTGEGEGVSVTCASIITRWVFTGGEAWEEDWGPWRTREESSYRLDINFADSNGTVGSSTFDTDEM